MAEADPRARERQPYMTVTPTGSSNGKGQLHWSLGRTAAASSAIRAQIGQQYFRLVAGGHNAWVLDVRDEAAMRAAMRDAGRLTVLYRDPEGRSFSDRYKLSGAPTAMDAASLACSNNS